MNYQPVIAAFFSSKRWPFYLTCIIIFSSQAFTAVMNIINGLIWWGRIDRDLILIGCVDSLVVTLLISPIAIYLIRHSFNLEEMNRILQKEIEEKQKAKEALKVSEELYQLLFNSINEVVYSIDINYTITSVSPSIEKYLGFKKEEFIGKSLYDLKILPERYIEKALSQISRVLQGEILKYEEYGFFTEDGRIVYAEVSGAPIIINGKIIGMISVARDISARKEGEETQRGLEARLQRAEKMESLGLMAGGVAHDLNNVLGIVVGYAELLLLKESKSSAIRPQLEEIMKGGQKAAAIVVDLLTLARRGVPGSNILNLNSIISDFQKSSEFKQLSSFHSSVQIKAKLEPDLPNISCSSIHLGKTIFNLVSNASEAMLKGGVLTIKTANHYLEKPIYGYDEIREGDYVVLSVSDTGEGIPAADLKRIFEPFYTKKVMGRSGTGLGLAVVWGTVKDHNGYINVESEEGKGSTFTLYFPVTREELSAENVPVSISEYMGKGEPILIVDDVKEQRALATAMLKELNYSVSSVKSGEEAVAYLKGHKADLMILDMIMDPGMDGLDTYRSVLEILPKQKAIIVSGFSESERVKAARTLGAGAYVKKPYVIEKLGLAVKKELDRSA